MKMSLCQMIAIICILAVGLTIGTPFAPDLAHGTWDDSGCRSVTYHYPDGTSSIVYSGFHGHSTSHTQQYHNGSFGESYMHPSHSTVTVNEYNEDVFVG